MALLDARSPLSFAEIRQRTGLYPQSDDESARRMFERDKRDLDGLGVPITMRRPYLDDEPGYIVERRDYELADVELTPDEVAALAIALQQVSDPGARRGLAKIAARAPDPATTATPSATVTFSDAQQHAVDVVGKAVIDRQPVRFAYRSAAGQRSERHIDPYAVVRRRGATYVVGHDHTRAATRAFRVERIDGDVKRHGEAGGYEVPADLDLAAAVTGPATQGSDVELAVADAARWEVELRGGRATEQVRDGWPVYRLADQAGILAWVLSLGAEVEVVAPSELRERVIAALRLLTVSGGPA